MALQYLQRLNVGVSIPVEVLQELGQLPTSRAQRREWKALARAPQNRSIMLLLWLRARAYGRWNAEQPPWKRLFSPPRYLQYFWGLDSLSQLPSHSLSRLMQYPKPSQ